MVLREATIPDDLIDLRYLFAVWLKWSWVAAIGATIGLYFGYQNLQGFRPSYVASMIVSAGGAPTTGGGVQALASQLGVQFGDSSAVRANSFDRLQLLLKSPSLAQVLQEKYGLMQIIYRTQWDEDAGTWRAPVEEGAERGERIRAFLKRSGWSPPTLQRLANYVGTSVKVAPVGQGGFQRLSVSHADPEFAMSLLTKAYFEADELLREQDKRETANRKAYIQRRLATEMMVDFQDALRRLLAQELSKDIELQSDIPYAAKIVEPPHIEDGVTEPNLNITFGIPAILGAAFGFALVTAVAVFRRESK